MNHNLPRMISQHRANGVSLASASRQIPNSLPPMFPQTNINEITHVIQLAIAPVFLLTAVGTIIGVLVNRLGRVVDRIRVLEEMLRFANAEELAREKIELASLARRLKLIYLAVTCAVFCALFVGLLIIVAFIDALFTINLARMVGMLFVFAMLSFIASLIVFLREIFLAVFATSQTMK